MLSLSETRICWGPLTAQLAANAQRPVVMETRGTRSRTASTCVCVASTGHMAGHGAGISVDDASALHVGPACVARGMCASAIATHISPCVYCFLFFPFFCFCFFDRLPCWPLPPPPRILCIFSAISMSEIACLSTLLRFFDMPGCETWAYAVSTAGLKPPKERRPVGTEN